MDVMYYVTYDCLQHIITYIHNISYQAVPIQYTIPSQRYAEKEDKYIHKRHIRSYYFYY